MWQERWLGSSNLEIIVGVILGEFHNIIDLDHEPWTPCV